jgi:hypothetical protein
MKFGQADNCGESSSTDFDIEVSNHTLNIGLSKGVEPGSRTNDSVAEIFSATDLRVYSDFWL